MLVITSLCLKVVITTSFESFFPDVNSKKINSSNIFGIIGRSGQQNLYQTEFRSGRLH